MSIINTIDIKAGQFLHARGYYSKKRKRSRFPQLRSEGQGLYHNHPQNKDQNITAIAHCSPAQPSRGTLCRFFRDPQKEGTVD